MSAGGDPRRADKQLREGVVLTCPTHARRVRHTVLVVAGIDGVPSAVVLRCALNRDHRGYVLTRE
jgi:hypothetical protein